jgi:hypothetical protein
MIFFSNMCFYILFEIRNILVGALKYLYCLNNNYAIYGKNPVFLRYLLKLNSNGYLSLFFHYHHYKKLEIIWKFSKNVYKQLIMNRIFLNDTIRIHIIQ